MLSDFGSDHSVCFHVHSLGQRESLHHHLVDPIVSHDQTLCSHILSQDLCLNLVGAVLINRKWFVASLHAHQVLLGPFLTMPLRAMAAATHSYDHAFAHKPSRPWMDST